MNKKNISLDYVNGLVFDLEKAFWDERGKGARFRMTHVGREIYKTQCSPLINEPDIDHILSVVKKVLVDNGILADIEFTREDQTLRITMKGCLHLPVEEKMISMGIEPFTCVPANLIVMAIEDKINRQAEIAEIKTEGGVCQLLIVLFDRPAKIA